MEEKLYTSVVCRCVNVYGAMVEWYWQGKMYYFEKNLNRVWVVDECKCMEEFSNYSERGNWRFERKVLYCGLYMNEWVWSNVVVILTGLTELMGEKYFTVWVVDEWMNMERWWNYTDRGNWCIGKNALYSEGGRWMNEYGAIVENYWHG